MKDIVHAFSESSFSRSRWFPLGLQLGLLPHTLEEIRAKYNDDPEKCFYECLTQWLRGIDKVNESGGPTMESLANALNKIGEGSVATKITELLSNKKSLGSGFITFYFITEKSFSQVLQKVIPEDSNQSSALLQSVDTVHVVEQDISNEQSESFVSTMYTLLLKIIIYSHRPNCTYTSKLNR